MAVAGAQATSVGTTATLLSHDAAWRSGSAILLVAKTTGTLVLGGPTVAANSGLRWVISAAEQSIALDLGPEDALYGITASGTVTVDTLQTGI